MSALPPHQIIVLTLLSGLNMRRILILLLVCIGVATAMYWRAQKQNAINVESSEYSRVDASSMPADRLKDAGELNHSARALASKERDEDAQDSPVIRLAKKAQPDLLAKAIANLQKKSQQPWEIELSEETGYVKFFRAGKWRSSSPSLLAKAQDFIRQNQAALGVGLSDLVLVDQDESSKISSVVFQRTVDGIRFYNSKSAYFFNSSGELIYVVNDPGVASAEAPSPAISSTEAARAAELAVDSRYQSIGVASPHQSGFLRDAASQVMFNQGSANELAYRFVATLQAPLFGEEEVIISASKGTVLLQRNLSRR